MNGWFVFRGQIVPPPRSSRYGAMLLILLIVLFGLYQTSPFPKDIQTWVPCLFLLLLPLSIASRSVYTIHFNVLVACYYLERFLPRFPLYPFSDLTFLLLYFFAVMLIPPLRGSVGWLRPGKFDASVWTLVAITIVVPIIALMVWVHYFSPDLGRYANMVPHFPLWLIALYAVANAAFNAALEETIWRGVMLEALDSAFGPGIWPLLIQSVSFAAAHYRHGFPNGIIGSAMVVVFGMMLGVIRRKSKGVLAGWLAHTAVDAAIFTMIVHFIRQAS
ncbi:MAG TPA: CPBP family intramembrane glutamic endopeptidase [Candidatus Acidoferrales bacterium]|jgi:membrane protease YdiL (CAAX protease family)|nr:CPBP family intramembrane glutamic endopeptidase [Candidatus Acidoferrales bacterium]